MPHQRSLIVVADRQTAQFYLHARPGAPLEPFGLVIEQPSQGDPTADRPGRAFDSAGMGRHAMEPTTSYREQERIAMVRNIIDRVNATFAAGEVQHLVLIAEPQMLGELRHQLAGPIRERVALELPNHLTQASVDELAERLTSEGSIGLVRGSATRAG